jgi:hypothetical protein
MSDNNAFAREERLPAGISFIVVVALSIFSWALPIAIALAL